MCLECIEKFVRVGEECKPCAEGASLGMAFMAGAGMIIPVFLGVFKNCVFKDNSGIGIYASNQGTIHLHGEATAIHSNGHSGIYANGSSKVLIHLPSHHNTIYNPKAML